MAALSGSGWAHAESADCQAVPACERLLERGKLAHNDKDYAAALELYAQAYSLVPDAGLLVLMGRSHAKRGEHRMALELYRRAAPQMKDKDELARTQKFISESEQALVVRPEPDPPAMPSAGTTPAGPPKKRPMWRLVAGGIALGGGALMTGFGISALTYNGRCAETPLPAQDSLCLDRYVTTDVGAGLVGTGAALMIGATILMAIPGR